MRGGAGRAVLREGSRFTLRRCSDSSTHNREWLRHGESVNQHMLNLLPPEGIRIVLTLFLSFLIGLEREEQKAIKGYLSFGGVRTFPLIGLMGYALALISGDSRVPVTAGFVVVAAFLLL